MGGGAWPFLVGGVICLVNSDNERDSVLLNSVFVFAYLCICVFVFACICVYLCKYAQKWCQRVHDQCFENMSALVGVSASARRLSSYVTMWPMTKCLRICICLFVFASLPKVYLRSNTQIQNQFQCNFDRSGRKVCR